MSTHEDDPSSIEAAFQTLSLDPTTTNGISKSTAIATLATASRQSPTIRQKLADPQTLHSITTLIDPSLSAESLETTDHALRCIANACIDNPSARDTLTSRGLTWLIPCLSSPAHPALQLLTTKVVHNLCSDHDAAQQQCYRDGVHLALIRILTSDPVRNLPTDLKRDGELDGALTALFWIAGQKASVEPTLAENDRKLSPDLVARVVGLHELWVEDWDVETWATVLETTLVFLRDATVQTRVVRGRLLGEVREVLRRQEGMVRTLERAIRGGRHEHDLPGYCAGTDELGEDVRLLAPLSASLVWVLSDLAANPAFVEVYSLEDADLQGCIADIRTAAGGVGSGTGEVDPNGHRFNSACQILGNLLWALPLDKFAYLVLELELHACLFDIIAQGDNREDTLHSIGGLLVQLSRASVQVRQQMGGYEVAPRAIDRLCRHERPEIKQGSIKLLKALGKDCPVNQRRFADLAQIAMAALQPPVENTRHDADSAMIIEEEEGDELS